MKSHKEKKIIWGEDLGFSGPRDFFRNSLILKEVLRNKKHGDILDFGCGSGHLTFRLINKGFSVCGIDSSPLVFQHLLIIKTEKQISKLQVVRGNEKTLFKLKKKFDVVVSGEVLEHLKDDIKAVKGFCKLLKDDGICIVTVPSHPYLWDVNDDYSSHFRRYEKENLIALFEKAGFKIKKCFYFGFPLVYLWHKFVFLPFITRRLQKKQNQINPSNPFSIDSKSLNIMSIPFWIDQLFNWTEKGGGLLLVAEK